MQRHAEGYGDLWNKQTSGGNEAVVSMTTLTGCNDSGKITNTVTYLDNKKSTSSLLASLSSSTLATAAVSSATAVGPATTNTSPTSVATVTIKAKPNDWVVIPVFGDIVRLAINAREDCLKK